ncbi:DSBA family oxidoreductase [Emericellopsis atlantica]|uniref:Glutathione S-transferase kappa n=1 Tax=Emericellopsis atlantica TaxID=2614577 RepID=A0A9P7ZFN8_9HYPO|nr:DSBA family oxidoreductase [Emericellopsis atlantica]KAG9250817.1 DSBA family oxidoreductase [Emericellopsis atlantica]
MQPKKIEAYIDIVSAYSYYAFSYLRKNSAALKSAGVEVEFIPVFLGGINVSSGNKPPWTLPAKAAYSRYDGQRAQKYFGLKFNVPGFFPIVSLLPQRCLAYVKKAHPDKLEPLFDIFFQAMWVHHHDLSKPNSTKTALLKVFTGEQVAEIMAAAETDEIKKTLSATTLRVSQDLGAFGCPWFWVHDGKGHAEPFFGSDRFHFMWDYLEIPHTDLELVGPVPGKL